jgi:hypothetical protein
MPTLLQHPYESEDLSQTPRDSHAHPQNLVQILYYHVRHEQSDLGRIGRPKLVVSGGLGILLGGLLQEEAIERAQALVIDLDMERNSLCFWNLEEGLQPWNGWNAVPTGE